MSTHSLIMSVQRRKEQARAREEAKKARHARKTGAFVTLSTLGTAPVLPTLPTLWALASSDRHMCLQRAVRPGLRLMNGSNAHVCLAPRAWTRSRSSKEC